MTSEITFSHDIPVQLLAVHASDDDVIAAARISTVGDQTDADVKSKKGFINFLMKGRHGTPFEHNFFKFMVTAPIFVWREHHRHRIGMCLAGSSRIPVGTQRNGSTKSIEDIYRDWKLGVPDTLGRKRMLPSCQNLVTRTLNLETGLIEYAQMVDVYQSGIKPILDIKFMNGKRKRTLRCTADHRIWTNNGWVRAGELQVGDMIARQGKVVVGERQGLPKRLRMGIQEWSTQQKRDIVKPIDKCHVCKEDFLYSDLEIDHKIPISQNIELALVLANLAPICVECHTKKSAFESWSENVVRRPVQTGARFTPILSIKDGGEEMTYDIEMPAPWHNFIADDVVVHNSYNEESGRYKQLAPHFYFPAASRPLVQIGKAGAYEFVAGTPAQLGIVDSSISEVARTAYAAYQRMLDEGIAREVARMVLPVNTFSSCIVTMNARSLMNFLSLRTKEEGTHFPSYPQAEIEMVARQYEEAFAQAMPLTHKTFCQNGRVAP